MRPRAKPRHRVEGVAGDLGEGGGTVPDPNGNQFRTINGVKYVEGEAQVPNSQPDPYVEVSNWPQLPAGRKLGAISAIGVGPDGKIWVADRCKAGIGALWRLRSRSYFRI